MLVVLAGNDKDRPRRDPRLLQPIAEGRADFVQGSRYLPGGQFGNMPFYRAVATRFVHPLLFSLLVRRRFTDTPTASAPFRLSMLRDPRIDLDAAVARSVRAGAVPALQSDPARVSRQGSAGDENLSTARARLQQDEADHRLVEHPASARAARAGVERLMTLRLTSKRFRSSTWRRSTNGCATRSVGASIASVSHGHFILGQEVEAFEQEFAAFCRRPAMRVGVASGLDALRLALVVAGIGPGDEVLIPGEHVHRHRRLPCQRGGRAGARRCRSADATPSTSRRIEAPSVPARARSSPCISTDRQPTWTAILDIAGRHGLRVIEDACQAHGAWSSGRVLRHAGRRRGASVSTRERISARSATAGWSRPTTRRSRPICARLRSYGEERKYHHISKGLNARLDALQAAVLRVKLPRLAAGNEARSRHARAYSAALAGIPAVVTPAVADAAAHVHHLYVIRTPRRDQLQAFLKARGIQTGVHYPIPIHRQPAYAELSQTTLPVTEQLAGEILSLPMFPELTDAQIARVAAAIREFHDA